MGIWFPGSALVHSSAGTSTNRLTAIIINQPQRAESTEGGQPPTAAAGSRQQAAMNFTHMTRMHLGNAICQGDEGTVASFFVWAWSEGSRARL